MEKKQNVSSPITSDETIISRYQGSGLYVSPKRYRKLRRRHWFEHIFRLCGLTSVFFASLMLAILISNIALSGASGFWQTRIEIDVLFDQPSLKDLGQIPKEDREQLIRASPVREILMTALAKQFPGITNRRDRLKLFRLLSINAKEQIITLLINDPTIIGQTRKISFLASDDVDQVIKGNINLNASENNRRISNIELGWLNTLKLEGRIDQVFASSFFMSGDSSEPEIAGILGALSGSFFTLMITLLTALPLGVLSAIYLEEFARKNEFTRFLEININNLAAVPSVIYGLLGLFLFLGLMNLPRSSPLVGGLTLALMTLPTIIIASRAAIRSVPTDIRIAAQALGASRMQVMFNHVFPAALPGVMTGSIIGMSRALGETAPLLMIGMIAFIVAVPTSVTDPATVLPVQIYLWSDSSERAFIEKTSAAIMVLLGFLVLMNGLAIWVRQSFKKIS